MRPPLTSLVLAVTAFAAVGCASPGPPRAPSLYLPAATKNLSAERIGSAVTLRFTVPQRTTDDLALRGSSLGLRVCRELDHSACTPLPQFPNTISTRNPQGGPNTITLTDTLPTALATGAPHLLAYRVQFLSQRGRPGPLSDAAYTAAGQAPAAVTGLTVSGSRLGILLSWQPAPADGSELLLHRDLVPSGNHKEPATLLLRTSENRADHQTLDTSPEDGLTYRYTAYREAHITLGGRTLVLRSEPTLPTVFTLHDTYPPPTPTDLTAAAFTTNGVFAVDLIWQPVEDPGLAGYLVYRETVTTPATGRVRLTPKPIPLPAFHDTTAAAGTNYRYLVTSIDVKGNESGTVAALVGSGQ